MSLHTSDATTPQQITNNTAEQPRLVVDLKRSGTNTPAELSPGSVNSDPDDGCDDKYSCRSGESEVTATVHDDVPETSTVRPHSMFSASDDTEHNSSNRPSISASTHNGPPEATITSAAAATSALPTNKKPNLLNTYMRRLFDHYKVNFVLIFDV